MCDEQELIQLEVMCKQLYESSDTEERKRAENALFSNNLDLMKCRLLLDRKNSSYAQLLAASTISKIITRNPSGLSLEQRLDIRNYILNYLASNSKLAPFVLQGLVTLFARITKIGWFESTKEDEYVFREIIPHITPFVQGNVEFCNIGVQLISNLVIEMNQPSSQDANRSLFRHRKVASSFRDKNLFEFFQLSQDLLQRALDGLKSTKFLDDNQQTLISNLLKLTINCLSFDFIGASSDDSSDDLTCVQIPTNWRPVFLDANTLKLYFDLFHLLPSGLSALSLSCLVQLASVRRTLFNNIERGTFLNNLITGIRCILENPQGLSDPSTYHEFCRLLARLKTNYQLGELVKAEEYPKTLELIANFTITSLRLWTVASNSIHYLLILWQKMVTSVPYVKANEPHLLERFAPEITRAYITSRLDLVNEVVLNGLDDPFEEIVMIQQQLEQLSTIARCEYESTCTLLVSLFDQTAKTYQELMQSILNSQTQLDVEIQENRLTWLVYIIGAAIGGRVFLNSSDEQDHMDGELAFRVLQLMNYTDVRLSQGGFCKKLELAFLSFFEQFRKTYVGDQVQKTSSVYKRLSEVLGLNEETMVLSVFVRKIITNLKYWGNDESIVLKTLKILSDLSIGYSSVRKLVQLDEIQFILNSHTPQNFPFLSNTFDINYMKCRTIFYTSLGRLFMIDSGEDEDKFEKFMQPLTTSMDTLKSMLSNKSLFGQEETKRALIGIARDLRGLVFSFVSKSNIMIFFNWIYPAYTPVFHAAIDMWCHDPQVTTPILKLYAELVNNRSQRLQFEISSPNGILLFRDASKLLVNYGSKILMIGDIAADQIYPLKLKGISICFSILKLALSGSYVNFGVFQLYGDRALDDALNTIIKLILSITISNILEYPKLSQSYYILLECIAQDHMKFLANLEPNVFFYIISSISEGLNSLDQICTACCSILDHIVTYIFKEISKQNKKKDFNEVQTCIKLIELKPEILQQMLSTILNIIMFEDCRNQWSMSRPLLGLILLNEDYFNQLRQSIIAQQPLEKQATMNQLFDDLMNGIERNLLSKNRDRLTQQISQMRKSLSEYQKTPTNSGGINDMMN
ncbi:PREDICTED: exportin-7-like [Rhagoletis zephyria]|uniref:exportin-7-like n=1 Tax=Rhagoletis zephyria TaxID=28612 RepID=UPI0008112F3B|nr:PREDICTED: exportin-7-like [Rhagoletis zephyria]